MAENKKIGDDCYLYRNSGTYGAPTWVEVENVIDLSRPSSRGRAEFRTRGKDVVRERTGKQSKSIEFNMATDTEDTDWAALKAAYDGRASIEVAAVNGPIATSNTQGLRMTCEVAEFSEEEPLEAPEETKVVLVPAVNAANDPEWMDVT